MKKFFLLFFLLSGSAVFSQGYKDTIFNDSIKTVQLHSTEWELSYPIITLNSNDQLELGFDELSSTKNQYYYTIEHCGSDWNTSDLTFTDYAEGYLEIPIYDFKYSSITTFHYIHYSCVFPKDELKIKLSGNYIVKVFADHDPSKLVLIKRFYVVDSKANIDITVNRPVQGNLFQAGQQIDFKITHQIEDVADPRREFRVIVSQNFRFDNAIYDIQPVYMEGNMMDYTLQKGNIMPAGSEFRSFDIKDIRYVSQYIQRIELHIPYYHYYLLPSLPRTYSKYSYEQDINGRYKIAIGKTGDPSSDADYVFVHFSLPMDAPDPDGDFYVYGQLSDWQCKTEYKLNYSLETKAYELTALFKQGYYNYEYVYKRHKSEVVDHTFMEGNHWETENDYYVFFYYRPFASRYEQLIGVGTANSVRKQ